MPLALRHRRLELRLRHAFGTARGVSARRHNLVVEVEADGWIGRGEAAPIARYGQDVASAERAVEAMAARLAANGVLGDAANGVLGDAAAGVAVPGQRAAQAAVDAALHDLAARRRGVPLYAVLGLDPSRTPATSLTIGLDTPERMAAKTREAAAYSVLKVKLGTADDRALFAAVRGATDRPLRVDANEGWTLPEARQRLRWLADEGVELVEQPLPAAMLAEARELHRTSPLPLYADESALDAADVPRLVGAFDGVNVKLAKCGGIGPARRMIAAARAHGLKVMLGCMVESSLGITAAAHLSPLVDLADLDGNLLLAEDPFVGVEVRGGRLVLPARPGLGVEWRTERGP